MLKNKIVNRVDRENFVPDSFFGWEMSTHQKVDYYGYAQVPRASMRLANKRERRVRTCRQQTHQGALAIICAEADSLRGGPIDWNLRRWAKKFGWHPEQVSRFFSELEKEAGWSRDGDYFYPPPMRAEISKGVTTDLSCDINKQHCGDDVTDSASHDKCFFDNCDQKGVEGDKKSAKSDTQGGNCDDCDGDVTTKFNDTNSPSGNCDDNVTKPIPKHLSKTQLPNDIWNQLITYVEMVADEAQRNGQVQKTLDAYKRGVWCNIEKQGFELTYEQVVQINEYEERSKILSVEIPPVGARVVIWGQSGEIDFAGSGAGKNLCFLNDNGSVMPEFELKKAISVGGMSACDCV